MKNTTYSFVVLNIDITSFEAKSITENDSITWTELTYRSGTKQAKIDLKKELIIISLTINIY